MNRFALAASTIALFVACFSLKSRPAPVASVEIASPAPAVERHDASIVTAAPAGISYSESSAQIADAIAVREREIVDRIWPGIARFRELENLAVVPKPSKLDDALALFLEFARPEEAVGEKQPTDITRCMNEMKQLGVYCCLFESKFKRYPGSIDDLKRPDLLANESILVCPLDKSGDACSFEYLYPIRGDGEPGAAILAYDKHVHANGKRCVLYFSGRVEEANEADFQTALATQLAADRAHLAEQVAKVRERVSDASMPEQYKEICVAELAVLEKLNR